MKQKNLKVLVLWGSVIAVGIGGAVAFHLLPSMKELSPVVNQSSPTSTLSKSIEGFFRQGTEKYDKQNYKGAIADYDEAIRLKPDFAEIYYNRGNAKSNLGDQKGAIADYDEAIRLKPDFAVAYNNRGSAKRDLGDQKGAIADYTEAIRLKPDFAVAYYNRGSAKRDLGDKKGAIADYTEAARLFQQKGNKDYRTALSQIEKLKGKG